MPPPPLGMGAGRGGLGGLPATPLLSRTSHDRLLSATAGAAVTLAALWLALITAAAATVILRA